MRIKNFKDWVNEDFTAVGIAPEGNVIGMGNVTPPSASSTGSGDAWPSLGAPATQTGSPKKKRRKKKKKKKLDEGSSDLHEDSDISHIQDAILTGAANDESVSDKDWIDFFSNIYRSDASDYLNKNQKIELRNVFSEGKTNVWVTMDWEEEGDDGSENVQAYEKDGWKVLGDSKTGEHGEKGVNRILIKAYTEKEIEDNYQEVLDEIKTNREWSKKEFDWLFSNLKTEDKEKYAGVAHGKPYGV